VHDWEARRAASEDAYMKVLTQKVQMEHANPYGEMFYQKVAEQQVGEAGARVGIELDRVKVSAKVQIPGEGRIEVKVSVCVCD